MEQQHCFSNLPTEALFSFFCSLDPFLLGTYSTVCKKWAQMCRDNELWRQYCIERWDKNPKESDCAKNWLIPVREGGGSKENRIDWRRCYLLRSHYDSATKFFQLVPEKKQRLGFLKRKGKKASQADADLFANGWPSAEDLFSFEKRVKAVITKITSDPNAFDIDYMPDHTLLFLFLELELSILRRINISRVKYLGFAGRFLDRFPSFSRIYAEEVPPRLVEFAAQYAELAAEKDIPSDIVAELFEKIASIFIDLIGNVVLHPEFSVNLTRFISLIISSSMQPMKNGLKQWAFEQEDMRPTSPTQSFEQILHLITNALTNKPDLGMSIFSAAIRSAIGPIETKEQIITMLSVISAIAQGCRQYILDNSKAFMTTTILPYWKPLQDAEYLVPLLHFVSYVLTCTTAEVIQMQFVNEIIPPLLEMAKHENHNVQREVAHFIISYCAYLNDEDTLVPYLADLLEVFYDYFESKYASVRKEAVFAVSSLILTCSTSFSKNKDRMMKEFRTLLANGNASDREAVVEALSRIGVGIGDQKSSIEADIEVLYDQVVEDCKRDRDAHLDMLLKMTEFEVEVLGPKFSKYIPFVLPLIFDNARIPVVEEKTEDIEMDDGEEVPNFSKPVFLKQASERKDAALGAILNMLRQFDRTMFLPIHEDIGAAVRHIITNLEQNVHEQVRMAGGVYSEYIQKLFEKGDPEWCTTERMMEYWLNSSSMFVESIDNIDLIQTKSSFMFQLTKIFKHLCKVSTPSQPFLTDAFMQRFTEETFSAIWSQFYRGEAQGIPPDEVHDFGSEIVHLMEAVCATSTDKEIFWNFADPVLQRIAGIFEDQGLNEYRWFDACLICTVFDYFGNEFLNNDRAEYLHLVATCKEVQTKEMYQCLANYLGVMARKYPNLVPVPLQEDDENIDYLFKYLEDLLIGEECQRDSGPAAYDNALMAMSGLVLFLVSLYEQNTNKESDIIGPRIKTHFATLTSALPPADNGDQEEALICITQYCQILVKTQFYFQDENGAELKLRVIDALQQTLQMSAYDTPEVHQIVDPVLETLRAQ